MYGLYFFVFLPLLCGCARSTPEVCIEKKSGERACVKVEIARTSSQRQLGLMYRKSLPQGAGMLFMSDEDRKETFTMKNTLIPLDMIFINSEKKIVGWVENTKPLTDGPYGIEKKSRYVLEVNAFFCKEKKIAPGDQVMFKNIEN